MFGLEAGRNFMLKFFEKTRQRYYTHEVGRYFISKIMDEV